MWSRLRARQEVRFFVALVRASPLYGALWLLLLVLRGAIPAVLAIAIGRLVGAVEAGESLTGPLAFVGVIFVAFQIFTPLQLAVGQNLGSRTADWLNDRLMRATVEPEGIGHLERPELTNDLTMARDFDLGITGPPLFVAMDFIAAGLVELVAGVVSAVILFRFAWWAPPVLLVGWGLTHVLLRESGVWKDRNTDEVRTAQRHADYHYRLAVDPPAAKELRMFGLAGWVVERFGERRRRLYDLQWEATRLRERSVAGALVVVAAANIAVFWALADGAAAGRLDLEQVVVFLQLALGTSAIAFGGLSWALDGASAPVAAVARLEAAMGPAGRLERGTEPAQGLPAQTVRFRDVTFQYESGSAPVLEGFDLTIPAGSSMAIVGVNGAGKTTIAKLLCRLYDPQRGAIELDGVDLRRIDLEQWRGRIAAVFQDYVRYEKSLRANVAPNGADDTTVENALDAAGGSGLAELDTVLSRGYAGGTDLSGGQWQRVALARTLASVADGAGVVILDEPTAQLDVRGEAEIFERILAATRECTTILVSHRFSTVRQVDTICVLEEGRVIELGSHDELMALGGRYRTMFDLQASRFNETDDEGQERLHDHL